MQISNFVCLISKFSLFNVQELAWHCWGMLNTFISTISIGEKVKPCSQHAATTAGPLKSWLNKEKDEIKPIKLQISKKSCCRLAFCDVGYPKKSAKKKSNKLRTSGKRVLPFGLNIVFQVQLGVNIHERRNERKRQVLQGHLITRHLAFVFPDFREGKRCGGYYKQTNRQSNEKRIHGNMEGSGKESLKGPMHHNTRYGCHK